MRLPLRVEEISAAWLTAALRERLPGVTVDACRILDVMPGTSTKVRVGLDYAQAGREVALPATLIVKGGFEEHSASMRPMYRTEMRFYRDVQRAIDLPSPRCWFAGEDETEQSVIILEDLRSRGVRFCDPLKPQTADEVARRLEVMARYHAQTWNSNDFAPGGRFEWISGRHEGWSVVYQQRYLEPSVWQHYMQLPRAAAVSSRLHDGRGPACLCHGDTHLGNLYWDRDGTPGFFDPQVARAPWQFEVTYHLVAALDPDARRRHERDLLRHYLEALRSHGIDAPAAADALEAYRREIVYGLFIFLINETRFQSEAVNTAYAARFGAAALDHGTRDLLGAA